VGHYIIPHLFWYLAKQAPFRYQKIMKIFGDLRWFIYGPLSLCFIFFFAFCIFYAMCPICGPLLLNAKSVVQHFFYFHLKRANNNKRVNNKRWHRKILLQIKFFVKLVTDSRFRNIVFFLGLCNIYERQS
jgi:hypothetical protein